jgi:hypothetical protein
VTATNGSVVDGYTGWTNRVFYDGIMIWESFNHSALGPQERRLQVSVT